MIADNDLTIVPFEPGSLIQFFYHNRPFSFSSQHFGSLGFLYKELESLQGNPRKKMATKFENRYYRFRRMEEGELFFVVSMEHIPSKGLYSMQLLDTDGDISFAIVNKKDTEVSFKLIKEPYESKTTD